MSKIRCYFWSSYLTRTDGENNAIESEPGIAMKNSGQDDLIWMAMTELVTTPKG